MASHDESLLYCVREYARYLVPMWLVAIYVITFGVICQHFKLGDSAMVLFGLLVLPVFFGAFLWSRVPPISRFHRCVLTMLVPFLIFILVAAALMVIAVSTGASSV